MKGTGMYLIGYIVFIGGVLAALWKMGVLASIGMTWTVIGVVILIGFADRTWETAFTYYGYDLYWKLQVRRFRWRKIQRRKESLIWKSRKNHNVISAWDY